METARIQNANRHRSLYDCAVFPWSAASWIICFAFKFCQSCIIKFILKAFSIDSQPGTIYSSPKDCVRDTVIVVDITMSAIQSSISKRNLLMMRNRSGSQGTNEVNLALIGELGSGKSGLITFHLSSKWMLTCCLASWLVVDTGKWERSLAKIKKKG